MYYDINGILKRELDNIESIISNIEADLVHNFKMKGHKGLSFSIYGHDTSEGIVYYKRFRKEGKQRSIRLGNSTNSDVIKIRQVKYNNEMLSVLEADRKLLQRVVGKFLPYDPESIDKRIRPAYRDDTGLVNKVPGILSSDEWAKINKRNRYALPDNCNITVDGIKARSKSEVIVYGILKGHGLMIKCDMEITLKDEMGQNVVVSPDFIILCDDGSFIIIEHLGMLDSADYLEKVIRKIHLYQINGYRLNENLFITADYAQGKINAQVIEELVRNMILPRVKGIAG